MNLGQNALARALRVPPGRINDIVHGRRSITADTAARLAIFFGTSPEFWLNLQAHYDAKIAQRDLMPKISKAVRRFVPPAA